MVQYYVQPLGTVGTVDTVDLSNLMAPCLIRIITPLTKQPSIAVPNPIPHCPGSLNGHSRHGFGVCPVTNPSYLSASHTAFSEFILGWFMETTLIFRVFGNLQKHPNRMCALHTRPHLILTEYLGPSGSETIRREHINSMDLALFAP